jgi:hypothetical protein
MLYIELLKRFWKPLTILVILLGVAWTSYNKGYDAREAIAKADEQAYAQALQESMRKKYVFEQVFVPKYIKERADYEGRIDDFKTKIDEIPPSEVVDCRIPDAAIGVFNESLFGDAATTSGNPSAGPSVQKD